ncbi:MAG: permease-like cell division protein FtsX [Microgenomates group bacterium]
MRSLNSALTTIRRSPYQAMASVLLLAVTFYVAYSFSFFLLGANKVLQHFETRPQIIAFFELEAETSSINTFAEQMRQKSYVQDVKVVTKEQALSIYQEENKDDPLLLELVTADILPASIEVSANSIDSLQQVKSDLEQLENVDDVVYQEDIIDSLSNWTGSMRLIGMAAVLLLSGISFLIILILIGIKAVHQKMAITIMRLIGATKWFVRRPFIVEGALYGILGSLLGWGATYASVIYATPWLNEFLGEIKLLPIPLEFYLVQLSIGTTAGMLLGALAGFTAVQRLLKG